MFDKSLGMNTLLKQSLKKILTYIHHSRILYSPLASGNASMQLFLVVWTFRWFHLLNK